MKKIIVIMAGGLGKRMNSDLPKVLHPLEGQPMICKLLLSAYKTNPFTILIIVGKYIKIIKDTIEKTLPKEIIEIIQYVDQPQALGTGHAIGCSIPILSNIASWDDRILILSGDTPLVSTSTMNSMFNSSNNFAMITKYDPNNIQSYEKFKDYGKIVLTGETILKIIEKKDCDENQLQITSVNCGIYCYNFKVLSDCIHLIKNNNKQNEYYLTDIIEIAKNNGYNTNKFELDSDLQYEIIGVNTVDQLNELESVIKELKL
jgi:bifunctional N-acetylglucosamine-1-phosphate-uridyltransferase/glucosamine-1-phosphate-acetyltransferase GlmU-like protein